MKNNYNININPKPMTSAEIAKHKDFEALLKRIEAVEAPPGNQVKTASIKSIYLWIGSVAAALLVGILVFTYFQEPSINYEAKSAAYFAARPYVNPPIQALASAPEIIKVDANEGGTYQFASGSRMVVPRAAFANSYGKLVEGEVKIHFKEYHDYVDFFLSGIPMDIEVDGKAHILESAGMIEVFATQDGEHLNILPEKSLEIELKSQIAFEGNTPPDFNIYYLDQDKRQWDLRGKDEIEIIENEDTYKAVTYVLDNQGNPINETKIVTEAISESAGILKEKQIKKHRELTEKLKTTITKIEKAHPKPVAPEKPTLYDGSSMTLELDFLKSDAISKNYEGTIWQILGNDEILEQEVVSTVWTIFDLKQENSGTYTLNLKKGEKQTSINVKPVLVGKDYERGIRAFEKELANYQTEMQKRNQEIAAKKREATAIIEAEKALADKTFEEKMAALKEQGFDEYVANERMKRAVINKFKVTRMGVWNCDRPLPPYLANLKGTFKDQKWNTYQKNIVYQADKSSNTVRRFHLDKAAMIQFNENSDNLLWIVTKENKLAIFYPDDFKRIEQKEGDYAFDMTLNETAIESEEMVRDILKF